MASSSSSSSTTTSSLWKHDVFLSFRGKETRKSFVSYLYAELVRKGINTFKDDKKLKMGSSISPLLLKAIEESRFSIIVITADYASSDWCLNELTKIMDCRGHGLLTVVPIFYEVDPSDVRNQTGSFAKAFSTHEKKFKDNKEKLQRWKEAMTNVANVAGYDSRYWENDVEMIHKIVRDISNRFLSVSSGEISDLVGMEAHMKAMAPLLRMESSDEVRIIGIWGMGGVGKTTIASYLYNRHSHEYQAHCFMDNVKEITGKRGRRYLQEYFLSEIFQDRDLLLWIPEQGSEVVKARLKHLKALIVLDDVDESDHLDAVARATEWFGPGSRIIITTRDKHLLDAHGVKHVYEVTCLSSDKALQLFSRYAFRQKQPEYGFKRLSIQAANHAAGLPLALRVLGSLLCGRRKEQWESALHELESIPHQNVMKALKVSYDGLSEPHRAIFLHAACLFNGKPLHHVKQFMDACGYCTEIGICVLAERSLLEISGGCIKMHDLLQQMGKELVRQQGIREPGKRQFLMDASEICDVLTDNTHAEAVEGVSLNMSETNELLTVNHNAFERMPNLKYLKIHNGSIENASMKFQLPTGLSHLPRKLRLIHWEGYPLKALPSQFRPQCLVQLTMLESNLEKLWEGIQPLTSLRVMDLAGSKRLRELPDLSAAMSLETLILIDCKSLVEIPSSVQNLTKLERLYLYRCIKLERLPSKISSKYLDLSECCRLKMVPEISQSVSELRLGGAMIEQLPQSFGHLSGIVKLYLLNCARLRTLPNTIGDMTSLTILRIWDCEVLGNLPNTVHKLNSLKILSISCCPRMTEFPHVPENIKSLELRKTGIKEVPPWIENLSRLEEFDFSRNSEPENPPCLSYNPSHGSSSSIMQSLKLLRPGRTFVDQLRRFFCVHPYQPLRG